MNVNDTSSAVAAMLAAGEPVRDLAAGGANMRSRGEKYLPKFPKETDEDYKARRESTWLFDGVGKAIDDYVDRLFDKPITPKDDGQLAEWCQNVDMENRDLSNFAQDVFENAVKDGISFIMVDAPRRDGEVTVGRARAQNLRPYLVGLSLGQVLGWKVGRPNGAPGIVQFRVAETVEDESAKEFEEKYVEQIRVLDLREGRVSVRLFQKGERGWVVVDEYLTDLDEIKVAPVYTDRTGYFSAKPPLARLAELNLAHWRSQSDQTNIMHHARAPLKYFHGYNPDELRGASEGPGYAFVSSNAEASAGVIEHGGAAIEAGRQELKDLEQQMQWVGLQLVMSRASGATATGDMIDEKKSTSALARWADNLKDALEIALQWMIEIGGIQGDPDVVMSRDTLATSLTRADMDVLIKMGMSYEALIAEAKRRGLVSEDLDIDEELERQSAVMDKPDGAV